MRRRGVDLVLIALLVAGLVFAASILGNAVTKESNKGLAGTAGPAQTATTGTATTAETRSSKRRHQIRVALYIGAAILGVVLFFSMLSAIVRGMDRRRYRSRPSRR